MSNNLGQIYATSKQAEKYIILDSPNVEVSGNFLINGTNSRMPAELENSIRNYLPLTYGTTDPNPNTLYDVISEVSNNLLISNNDASFNNVDISGNLTLKGSLGVLDTSTNDISYGNVGSVLTSYGQGNPVRWTTPYGGFTDYGIFAMSGTYIHDLTAPVVKIFNLLTSVQTGGGVSLPNSYTIQLETIGTYLINYQFDVQQITGSGNVGMQLRLVPSSGQVCYDGRVWTTWTTYSGSWVITTTTPDTTLTIQTSQFYTNHAIRIATGAAENQVSIFKMF